jgi:hypothetical protein
MILRRWLTDRVFDPNEPVCEIEVDGVTRLIPGTHSRFGPEDWGVIYRFFVEEGNEIGVFGGLFEFSDVPKGFKAPGRAPLHSAAKLKLLRRDRYPRIFLNYRREDSDAYAGRLHEVLAQEFGKDEVFMAEFDIRPGEVWDWTIQQAVTHGRVVLALVGRQWLTVTDSNNRRRIDDQHDLVRREIVAAMDRGTPLLPVLLPEAALPRSSDFDWQHELQLLPQIQFHRLTGTRHWAADVADLISAIREHLPKGTSYQI